MKHVISTKQFLDKALLAKLFGSAAEFESFVGLSCPKPLAGKVVATLFYEPSTRTRLSFESAVQRLGGSIISTENAGQFSSAAKGETLEDTIRTINSYADCIVIRHPDIGSAQLASEYSNVPIINAGDGAGEHPTQALLDLYTVQKAKGKIDGLHIGLVGDLLNGRTIHSLIQLLSQYKVTVYAIAPHVLQIPKKYQDLLRKSGIKLQLSDDWEQIIGMLDVIYMTRIQKERFKSLKDYEQVKGSFVLGLPALKRLNKNAVIMHPLPRLDEIAAEVDADPRAIYFEQAKNGLYVRMALLAHLFAS